MKPAPSFTSFLSVLPALALAVGCGGEAESLDAEASMQRAPGDCSFIPGCKRLLEAHDARFFASVMTYEEASGRERRRLTVRYQEALDSSFLLCRLFPSQPRATIVFVFGPEGDRRSVSRSMPASCPSSYGDNPGLANHASFSVVEDEDPALWDTLFPPASDGSRWFAVEVAAANAHGAWDSRHGANYRLVLRPR